MGKRPVFDRPVAHRGLHDRAAGIIENSASAFAAAIDKGYAIECDVQLSSDGVPVIFHDDELERLTGRKGMIRDLTLAEIQALPLLGSGADDHPQTLEAFLDQVRGRTLLQIELKQQQGPATGMLAKRAAEILSRYQGPLTVESFDPALLILCRRFGFKGPLGIISYNYDVPEWDASLSGAQKFFLRHLLHFPWTRFDFISCYDKDLDKPAIRFWHGMGVPLTAWTITSPAAAEAARRAGAQIVFEGFDPGRG